MVQLTDLTVNYITSGVLRNTRSKLLFIRVMYLRRPLTSRRFQKAVKRLIFALTACSISSILLFSKVWGRHTVDESSTSLGTIGGAGQQDPVSGDEGTVAARVSKALNVHVWRMPCCLNVTYLKESLFFPKYPDQEKFINDFQIEDDSEDYGQKIFGYLHPQSNGLYRFAIVSDDTSELWISTDENPDKKRLVARVFGEKEIAWSGKDGLDKYPEQRTKKPLYLQANKKYYVEVLHQQDIGKGFVRVFWTTSDKDQDFTLITSEYLSSFLQNTTHLTKKKVALHNVLSQRYQQEFEQESERISSKFVKFYSLPFISKANFLTSCDYNSSFVPRNKVQRNEGVKMVFESSVFPPDDTQMSNGPVVEWGSPNRAADSEVIRSVVGNMVAALRLSSSE